ncbi:hypothetical protein HMPREF1553_01403 [Porphyromonas gingivalis F0568]|nr:hypothetical protein HMPREF1553_01403 [Porphyromonas gingivalis F0568]
MIRLDFRHSRSGRSYADANDTCAPLPIGTPLGIRILDPDANKLEPPKKGIGHFPLRQKHEP